MEQGEKMSGADEVHQLLVFLGGQIAALVALPYGLALARLMGLPPELGLFTSIMTAPITSILGRNPVLIGGTASATVPFIAVAVRAQGVGGALYERMEYAPDGQLLNASYMDFLMPYASEVPTVEIDHLVTPSPLNPLGVKGAGEAGVIPGSAAIASAIEDAEGIPIRRMPISPSELFALRKAHA